MMKISRRTAIAYLIAVAGLTHFLQKDYDIPTSSAESSTITDTSVQQLIKNHINKIQFLEPIRCNNIPTDTEPHYTIEEFPVYNKTAVVDYPPWAPGKDTKHIFDENNGGLYHQILAIEPGEIFIDVGANIGQMAIVGLVSGVTTFAFDPLEYDMMKICSGVNETVTRRHTETTENLHLFRALVGNESQTNVSITRPGDDFGKFEQASLFANTIGVARKPKSYVKEYVPMITLDEVIPPHLPIGLVKIDVQGFEWPVVQGMKGLLERKVGYPRIVHYEEQRRVTLGAGFKLGQVQEFLEGYNYTCTNLGNDISCKK